MSLRRRATRSAPLRGTVRVPGDKSISHRALIIASLARGTSHISGVNPGADVGSTAGALRNLGARVHPISSTGEVKVEGSGELHEPHQVIDAGNSGSTARILAGVCAGVGGLSVLDGDASLRRRPMLRVVAPLRMMGATVDGRAHGELLPLAIRGGELKGIDHELSVASAQVKTALLLAGLKATGQTTLTEPGPSRDHTERMLRAAGVALESSPGRVSLTGGQHPTALDHAVPGDISSAMYLIAAATLLPGSELSIEDVGLNPTRIGGIEVLQRMGASIESAAGEERSGEPVGTVTVGASPLAGTTVPSHEVPTLIDEVPVLAVVASQAEGETVFEGVGELRAKESDRLEVMVRCLRTLGGDAEASGDDLIVRGPTPLSGGEVDSENDHRIALAFAVAGLVSAAPVRVRRWSAVDISFPSFLDVLGSARAGSR